MQVTFPPIETQRYALSRTGVLELSGEGLSGASAPRGHLGFLVDDVALGAPHTRSLLVRLPPPVGE